MEGTFLALKQVLLPQKNNPMGFIELLAYISPYRRYNKIKVLIDMEKI